MVYHIMARKHRLPRGRPTEKNASFRRTQSEQLLADVSAKLQDCRSRLDRDPSAVARPDPPKDLPKARRALSRARGRSPRARPRFVGRSLLRARVLEAVVP